MPKLSDVKRILNVAAANAAELHAVWEKLMVEHVETLSTDEDIDAALAQAQAFEDYPRIVQARYCAGPWLDFLSLQLDNGHRLLVPREQLSELKLATDEQASDLFIVPQGRDVWWP